MFALFVSTHGIIISVAHIITQKYAIGKALRKILRNASRLRRFPPPLCFWSVLYQANRMPTPPATAASRPPSAIRISRTPTGAASQSTGTACRPANRGPRASGRHRAGSSARGRTRETSGRPGRADSRWTAAGACRGLRSCGWIVTHKGPQRTTERPPKPHKERGPTPHALNCWTRSGSLLDRVVSILTALLKPDFLRISRHRDDKRLLLPLDLRHGTDRAPRFRLGAIENRRIALVKDALDQLGRWNSEQVVVPSSARISRPWPLRYDRRTSRPPP